MKDHVILVEACLEKIILCRQAEIMCRLIFHQAEFFGLSVARSLRSQSRCRFAKNVLITYGDRQGSGGAAPEARGLQGLCIWPNSWLFKWKFQVARLRKFSMHLELWKQCSNKG